MTEISDFIQQRLRREAREDVSAVEAARWLDQAGLLSDSGSRPGLPLRNRLRAGEIVGGVQRPGASGRPHWWFIERS